MTYFKHPVFALKYKLCPFYWSKFYFSYTLTHDHSNKLAKEKGLIEKRVHIWKWERILRRNRHGTLLSINP